jgi:O-antigen ligase
MVSLSSVNVIHYEDIAASNESDPMAFGMARVSLAIALIGAPWAFGAVYAWGWVSLISIGCWALFLWALGSVQQKVLKFFWSPLYIPLALFVALGLFQYGCRLCIDKWETRAALILFAGNLVFFFLAAQFFGRANPEARDKIGFVVVFFTGVLAIFSVLQFASGAQLIYWVFDTGRSNFFGPYGNPDHYAGLMELLIPVGVFYVAEQRRFTSTLALPILVITVAVASLLLSGSRAGLIALTAEVVIVLALGRLHAVGRERRGLVVMGFAIFIAAALFFWVDPGAVAQRLGTVASPTDAWTEWSSFRKSVSFDALRMLRTHPVLGIGMGNFEIAYPQFQSVASDLTVDYAHNDYAELMAETGLIGTALMLAALLLFFHLSFRDLGERLRSRGSWLRLGAAVGCCGLLVHSMFDFNLHIPANAAWFAVLAGIAITDDQALHLASAI